MRKLLILLAASTLTTLSTAWGQYSASLVHFTDNCLATGTSLAPPGFILNSCWNGIGAAANGKIYIAISDHQHPLGNTALFKYEPDKNQMTSLGTVKSASLAANNWMTEESQFKVHTFLLEHADGKMYFATDDYELPFVRGSHLYTIDTQTDQVADYSKTQPMVMKRLAKHNLVAIPNTGALSDTSGVFIQWDGIQGIMLNKRVPDLLYAFLYPDGDIIKYNLSTGAMARIDTANNSIMYEDNSGNLYFCTLTGSDYNLKKYNVSNGQVTIVAPTFDTHVPRMFCPTQGGDTVYCLAGGSTGNGTVYRLICSQNRLEFVVTLCGTYFSMQANLTLSPNGKTLYYITSSASGWERYGRVRLDTIPASCELISYIGAQGTTDLLQGRELSYGGIGVWDKFGNFYVPVWEFQPNVLDSTHIAVFKGHTPDSTTGIAEHQWQKIPALAEVHATPNPVIMGTRLRLVLPEAAQVDLSITDINGNRVATLVHAALKSGVHFATWQGTGQDNRPVTPGIYLCCLNGVIKEKLFVLKP